MVALNLTVVPMTAPGPNRVPDPSAPGPSSGTRIKPASHASDPSRAGGNRFGVITDVVLEVHRGRP